ncbi:hypothetical protein AAJ76_6300013441 [Vairimorpha ceranae]|uniref:Uncharacterized protein n=1 Tax=Vairimorpha ceranae TaxID=40302 RepID=A0A0F9WCG1_9MICR|nr:hypothetical protein AAJ76_6300013441 [Vairimorpha ceranae]KKO74525.1 hypothetical protein AAJ76_6300013441 [Vairimorpha ceranae]
MALSGTPVRARRVLSDLGYVVRFSSLSDKLYLQECCCLLYFM